MTQAVLRVLGQVCDVCAHKEHAALPLAGLVSRGLSMLLTVDVSRGGTGLQGGHSSEVLVAQPSRRIHEAAPSLPRLAGVIDV